jgi:hypothetical protein
MRSAYIVPNAAAALLDFAQSRDTRTSELAAKKQTTQRWWIVAAAGAAAGAAALSYEDVTKHLDLGAEKLK